jgi:drug/metabolite transporter (DMT)-like permease
VTILLALASSLLWGTADFFGGKTSRRVLALLVVLISQAAGLVTVLLVAVASGSLRAPVGYLPWAIGAGLAGASAVVLFYRALAIGTMGVAAPLASLGVIVPVVIGLFGGSLPSVLCLAGIVVAIGGVVTTAGPSKSAARTSGHARSVVLAIGAAAGFGLLQFAISGGSKYSVVMTMVAMRGTSVPVLAVITLITLRAQPRQAARARSRTGLDPRLAGLIAVIGIFDVSANLLFGLATVSGSLAIVAVLGSLYPAATVLLARFVDGERMSRVQNVGVLAALAGVTMIAAGS